MKWDIPCTILIGTAACMVKQFGMPGIITEEGHHRSYKYAFLLEMGIIHCYPLLQSLEVCDYVFHHVRADAWLEQATKWMLCIWAFSLWGRPASMKHHWSNLFHFFTSFSTCIIRIHEKRSYHHWAFCCTLHRVKPSVFRILLHMHKPCTADNNTVHVTIFTISTKWKRLHGRRLTLTK